jgi:hypothetical protein
VIMRIALATTRKGNMNVLGYVTKIKFLADEMASAKNRRRTHLVHPSGT